MFSIVLAVLVFVLSACASAPSTGPEAGRLLIEESAASVGGWAAMDAIKGQEIITGGIDWEPMQAMSPDGESRQVNTFGQTVLVDFENRRSRLSLDSARLYPEPGAVKFTEVFDGDMAMLETTNNQGVVSQTRLHPSRLAARLRDFNRLPLRVLYVAKAAADLTRADDRVIDGKNFHVLNYKDGNASVELHIEEFNKLPARVIYLEDDPIYSDTLNELVFSDWRQSGDIRLPHVYENFLNGKKHREERIRTLINNPRFEENIFTIPGTVREEPENGERILSQWTIRRALIGVSYLDYAREQRVEMTEVAPGIHYATGTSHNTAVVEMRDHIVVVEPPLYEERSAVVIRAIEEMFPGKPIRYVINTHFHIDHLGGVRAYAAKGATVLAPESTVPFIQEVLARPKTVRPDALAGASGAGKAVEAVSGVKTLTDGDRTIELRMVGNPHVDSMLMVYFPRERVLFQSDLYNPGAAVDPANDRMRALYTAVTEGNLAVDRLLGGHGAMSLFRDFARAMQAPARSGS
jgi:glyoxylase-like metal-dependent hydrolase (beta-lactamase superfamily II)